MKLARQMNWREAWSDHEGERGSSSCVTNIPESERAVEDGQWQWRRQENSLVGSSNNVSKKIHGL